MDKRERERQEVMLEKRESMRAASENKRVAKQAKLDMAKYREE